jgi:HPt (histidine-containing phosphotransfer) domain-containing protein
MDGYLSKPFNVEQLRQVLSPYVPAAARASGVLDARALEQIRALQQPGGADLVDKVVRLYLESSRALTEKIEAALGVGDANGVREAAHALKSSSANVGATGLADLARQLEAMGRSADLSQATAVAEQLFAEYQRVIGALAGQRRAA